MFADYSLWATMDEDRLQEVVIAYMSSRGWNVYHREYEVLPGYTQYGKGDLWFKKDGNNIVVEVKRKACAKVADQARVYGAWVYAITQGEPVMYCTFVGNQWNSVLDQLMISGRWMTKGDALCSIARTVLHAGPVPSRNRESFFSSLKHIVCAVAA